MRILVSYDISDDKRRREVAKIMEGAGYRVQYSVFECDLNGKQFKQLQRSLKPLVNPRQFESIRFYPLVAEAAQRVTVLGYDMSRSLGAVEIV